MELIGKFYLIILGTRLVKTLAFYKAISQFYENINKTNTLFYLDRQFEIQTDRDNV